MQFDARSILEQLVRFATPSHVSNAAITQWLDELLSQLGFQSEWIIYEDSNGEKKCSLVAQRQPSSSNRMSDGGGLAYFAHSDVVPADHWEGPGGPFSPTVVDGRLYGRGSCDMKGSLAAMISAVARIPSSDQTATIYIVVTADEEIGFHGAQSVRDQSKIFRAMVERGVVGIIGEPTNLQVVHAHKGITGFHLTSHGREAHSSTRLGINANVAMVPVLQEIAEIYHESEKNPELMDARFDPPSLSWTFGITDQTTAINITPGRCRVWVSYRPMPDVDGADLEDRVKRVAERHGVEYKHYPGGGYLWVAPNDSWVQLMCSLSGGTEPKTVSYGTDGGHFSELRSLVVCGPGDIAQAHTADEYIKLADLEDGVNFYQRILRRVITQS